MKLNGEPPAFRANTEAKRPNANRDYLGIGRPQAPDIVGVPGVENRPGAPLSPSTDYVEAVRFEGEVEPDSQRPMSRLMAETPTPASARLVDINRQRKATAELARLLGEGERALHMRAKCTMEEHYLRIDEVRRQYRLSADNLEVMEHDHNERCQRELAAAEPNQQTEVVDPAVGQGHRLGSGLGPSGFTRLCQALVALERRRSAKVREQGIGGAFLDMTDAEACGLTIIDLMALRQMQAIAHPMGPATFVLCL